MNILIFSRLYPPSVGGTETVMSLLAREFKRLGHDVTVITQSKGESCGDSARVLRRIGIISTLREILSASVVLHANISLREIWLPLLFRKSVFIVHHTWYKRTNGRIGIFDRAKLFLTRYVTNISVSRAISLHLPVTSYVVENPYDSECFQQNEMKSVRSKDIIAVGRLVSDKGFDILLEAISKINDEKVSITIVGDGPERKKLEDMARLLNSNIEFAGEKSPSEVAKLLLQHKAMVIPSVWEEPFGIVALEGLACGCHVIASNVGGLKDAIREFGDLVSPKNSSELAHAISKYLKSSSSNVPAGLGEHLAAHSPISIAKKYLSIFEQGQA